LGNNSVPQAAHFPLAFPTFHELVVFNMVIEADAP
jgi:hypothetical protein